MAVVRARLTVTGVSRRPTRPRGFTGRVGSVGHRLMVLVRGVFWRGRVHSWLRLYPSRLRLGWSVPELIAAQGKPGALTTAEREELSRLRKENRILAEERDILKKAAAFFAKQSR